MKNLAPIALALLVVAQLALALPVRQCMAAGTCGSCVAFAADGDTASGQTRRACCMSSEPARTPERSCCSMTQEPAPASDQPQAAPVEMSRCCELMLASVTSTTTHDDPVTVHAPSLISVGAAALAPSAEATYARRFQDPRGPPPAPRMRSAVLRL